MNKYTFAVLGSGQIELMDVNSRKQTYVERDHEKYDWLIKNQGRVVSVNNGRWTSSKDYDGYYGTVDHKTISAQSNAAVNTQVQPVVQLTKLQDLNIDDSLFEPMVTGTIFDKFCSSEGGILPATNIMAAGAPGVGKTTVLLDLLANLHNSGKKVLFISAEMSEMDMARYMKRFPNWASLPILFLNNYEEGSNSVIEQTLDMGWDLVLTDSYTEVNDTVKEHTGWTRGKTEKWFLSLMTAHNKGLAKKFTTFITILQLSKGGQFVGSNKLKHMTSAMMDLQWDGKENSGRRYMEFSKNRMGDVGKKLFFDLSNGVKFDDARYQRDLFSDALLEEERNALENESNRFDKIFGFNEPVTADEE